MLNLDPEHELTCGFVMRLSPGRDVIRFRVYMGFSGSLQIPLLAPPIMLMGENWSSAPTTRGSSPTTAVMSAKAC